MMHEHWQVACHAAVVGAVCVPGKTRLHARADTTACGLQPVRAFCPNMRATRPRFAVDADPLAAELDTHRRYLLRVAQLQLRDADLAEDVVQETLVAALSARAGFSGRSSLRTWLTGILKHKIVDAIRQRQRQPIAMASFEEETDLEEFDPLFRDNGAWQAPPADWGDPENALSRRQFMDVMEACLERLPANTARVFVMREIMELESDEICKELTITANNLWVILYRARMALRHCLEQNWFAAQPRR
jgi:RNA polymerase sigma-70 factor, ECF subfamily